MFEGLVDAEKGVINTTEVLNKLLDAEQIEIKTDLNITQIKTLVRIRWFMLNLDLDDQRSKLEKLEDCLTYYKILLCSVDRKSRGEIIDAVKEMGRREEEQTQSLIQGMQGIR